MFAWLATGLHDNGYSVSVLTLDGEDAPAYYALPDRIHSRALGLAEKSTNFFSALLGNARRIASLRSAILAEAPDLVVSFMDQTNVLALLAVGKMFPVVVSERVHPVHPIGRLWGWLRRRTYDRAAALVVQTRSIGREYSWLKKASVVVIANAVLSANSDGPTVVFDRPAIVGLGRLHPQKGFDLLIRAFARVAAEFPGWKVVVFGEGPERQELEARTKALGLAGRVFFLGRTTTPHADISQGDIFAFPSRFEGFPNALCEAMNVGMPCVAANCPGGPADLIDDGENGLLVPVDNVDALGEALRRLMHDPALRERLGRNASDSVRRFLPETTMKQWLNLISGLIGS